MIAYVSLVAVTNLILGMALARFLTPARVPVARSLKMRQPEAPATAEPLPSAETAPAIAAVLADDPPAATADPSDAREETSDPRADAEKPTLAALWKEFAAQLRDISDRIRYCRTAQDITLAQQAASRLKSFVKEWYAQFEECRSREQPGETSQPESAACSLGAVEMFAAQLETTLSNIDALDYTLPVDDVLDVLNRELETLDNQRRGFAKSTTGAK